MAARQKGSFSLGGTLEILADAPADARLCVKTKSELTDANSYPYKYVGMIVSVADEGKAYILTAADTTIASNWKELGEGGGGGGGTGVIIDATLTAAGWNSSNQQTLTFTGYESSMGGVIGMPIAATAAQKEAYAEAKINVVSQSGTSFTFECEEIPVIDLPVTLYAGGGSGGGGADLPSGGTTGQALVKKSNADSDVEWSTINSIPDGGTTGQVLAKHSATDKDVEWVDQIDTQKEIKDNGTVVTDRDAINFTDFDISDDSTNEETDIKAHRLTSAEMADIMSTLPGAPTQYPKYSTTEQVVGEWIDGKPIYQKTFTGTVPIFTPPNESVLDPATLDIAMDCLVGVFVSVSGFIQTVAGNYVPLPFTEITKNVTYKESPSAITLDSYPQTIAAYGRPNASTSMPNNIRVVNMNQNFNDRPLCVTAQYTKTTD